MNANTGLDAESIARVCHEANRAYCFLLGDTSQPPWDEAPEWQRRSAINGVSAHMKVLDAGDNPDPSWSHQLWLKEKVEDGWTYGPVKDPTSKTHPCCVPYSELPIEQRRKDYIFGAIVAALHTYEVKRSPVLQDGDF